MDIGFLIKRHREALGVTQSELAEQLGVCKQAIARWERDEEFPDDLKRQVLEWLKTEKPNTTPTSRAFDALVSLERLYHFRCGNCDAWWSVADRRPRLGSIVHCPDCYSKNQVNSIENE